MAVAWYVMHTKPKKENQVFAYLESQGFEVFYPSMQVKPVNPRALKVRPYFPRYIFVHSDIEEVGLSVLQWVPNAIGLVKFGGYAAPVPDHIVNELQKRVDEIRAMGGLRRDNLKHGDTVKITEGPLAGYEALFDMRLSGNERVQVLLEMLGRLIKVQVDVSMIERKNKVAR